MEKQEIRTLHLNEEQQIYNCSALDTHSYISERDDSKSGWQNYWRTVAWFPGESQLWIPTKTIAVYRAEEVSKEVSDSVTESVRELVNEIGLDFQVVNSGFYSESRKKQIQRTLGPLNYHNLRFFRKPINQNRLIELIEKETKKRSKNHTAEIILTDRQIYDDGVLTCDGFACPFESGIAHIVSNNNYHPIHTARVAKHEAGHLLGILGHHKINYRSYYKEPRACLMDAGYRQEKDETGRHRIIQPTNKICDCCLDRLVGFWENVEKTLDLKLMKGGNE